MGKLIDLTGLSFGRLVVLSRAENKGNETAWLCRCECGVEKSFFSSALRNGLTESCGCLRSEVIGRKNSDNVKHGMCRTRTHVSWDAMIQRCTNKNHKSYPAYGGSGITVCDRWLDSKSGFINFLADMGERPEKTSIDRIDGSMGYYPENCRWADIYTQNQNRKTTRA